MIGKLIKTEVNYILEDDKGVIIASTSLKKEGLVLSLKNCEAIANGYEFDEYEEGIFYAGDFGHPSPEGFSDEQVGRLHGFIDGFQKALELLADKKFSEDDMVEILKLYSNHIQINFEPKGTIQEPTDFIQSLQPKEWEVEIVTEPKEQAGENVWFEPKLDENGCLILRK